MAWRDIAGYGMLREHCESLPCPGSWCSSRPEGRLVAGDEPCDKTSELTGGARQLNDLSQQARDQVQSHLLGSDESLHFSHSLELCRSISVDTIHLRSLLR